MSSICGVDCSECSFNNSCKGCKETNGRPFGGDCILATCVQNKGESSCNACKDAHCMQKEKLIAEFNDLRH